MYLQPHQVPTWGLQVSRWSRDDSEGVVALAIYVAFIALYIYTGIAQAWPVWRWVVSAFTWAYVALMTALMVGACLFGYERRGMSSGRYVEGLTTSTVTSEKESEGQECPAIQKHTTCDGAGCRACWARNVDNVNYGHHTARAPKGRNMAKGTRIWAREAACNLDLAVAV